MDARSASGPRAGAASEGGRVEVHVPREEDAGEGRSSRPVPHSVERQPQGQHQHQHTHQIQGQRHQRQERDAEPSIPQIPPPPPSETPGSKTSTDSCCGRTVERLAHKLSEQDLQLGRYGHGQLQMQPTPPLPSSTTSTETAELRGFRSWAGHEVSGQSPRCYSGERTIPSVSIPTLGAGEPIEVDEEYIEKPDDRRLLDVRRLRRQTSSQLRARSNTRLINPRVEGLIASGTQCTVHGEGPSTPAPANTTSSSTIQAQPGYIEPDPDCAMPTPDIEADGMDEDLMSRDLLDLAPDGTMPLRYASGPGGIRKYTVGGVSLRYRLSVDVALRCQNVVRSRPRMRKRTKTRHGSNPSSAATSAINSPVLSSASSPPLPATHLSP